MEDQSSRTETACGTRDLNQAGVLHCQHQLSAMKRPISVVTSGIDRSNMQWHHVVLLRSGSSRPVGRAGFVTESCAKVRPFQTLVGDEGEHLA